MDHLQGRKQIASPEVAMASEVFDQFCSASTLKSILGHYRHLCDLLKMRPTSVTHFYPKLKSKLRSWKAQALWKKFDQRANHKCYNRGKACPNTRILIIGGGPCGLRSAIEAQLLGAKVVVVEKRDRMSRNNVLHLWPFVIQDLRSLGAKKFFGKFCAGAIDHISIRQLQCILLKVALILGVEFHENVSFEHLILPPDNQEEGKIGWRAKTTPIDHPVSQYEFDVLIGADGKRNTLDGFKRKEFRGKLAIAITANFINKRTEAEARVEEISGVAFIFNQKFFKELYQETGIDLENIVYYKDDTHYFVMTAKKHSLIDKGVILQDHADTAKLLAKENVDREALMLYAREAADFSTEYQMMDMEFAVNHYGQPDVAMFDFTSMYAAENASRVLERHGHRLFMTLVGDSLLEPFWPTGSGCARGFLSSLDACWAIKGWGASLNPLEVLAERESMYRLLGQTTPENLNRDYAAYTLDPHTRYPNLNIHSVSPIQVRGLLETDDPESIKQPPVHSTIDVPKKRRRRDTQIHPDTLLHWLQKQVALYDSVQIVDMGASFKNGLAFCAIIHRYRPDLIDFQSLKPEEAAKNNQLAFDILEKELSISPIMTGEEMAVCDVPDKLAMFSYLTQLYEAFRGEIPHIKHPKLEPEKEERPTFSKQLRQLTPEQKAHLIGRISKQETTRPRHSRVRHGYENFVASSEKKVDAASRRSRKRRSTEKMGATVAERQKRLEEIEKNRIERMKKRQYLRKMATQQFYKSMQMLAANAKRDKEEPFEDYSIFLYRQTAPDFKDRVKDLEQKILYPDREPKMHAGHLRGNGDDDFSGRIKSIEDKLRGTASTDKKPKDLLRAIGKIEKTDWNVKEIEKKIEENKMGRGVRHDKVERVPKWSREQFLARQIKMEKKGRDPKDLESKYADIDNTLKNIDRKIKEGNVLGHNKVSAMAEQFANKSQDAEPKLQRSNSKAAITLPAQGGSEMCHFCNKRVYLMERLSAEGKFFHRGCFRCEYCSTSLRIGNHTFDREKNGGRFYCTQHFGLPGTMKTRVEKKKIPVTNKENIPNVSVNFKTLDKPKVPLEGVAGLDLLDRGQTPERIEFENLARISDAEEAHSQMDEDEWTDRNFGASAAEMGSSDDISDMSDSDEDNEVFEEAIDQPLTTEGTLELAKNWTLRYSQHHAPEENSDTGSNEYEDSSDECTSEDEDSATATEDEDDVRARELRKLEVWLKVPPRSCDTDTGSETEVKISQVSIDNAAQEPQVPSESASVVASIETNSNSILIEPSQSSLTPKTIGDTNPQAAIKTTPVHTSEFILQNQTELPTCPPQIRLENLPQISELATLETDSDQTNFLNSECEIKNPVFEFIESEYKMVKESKTDSKLEEIPLPDAILSNKIDKTGKGVEDLNLQLNGDNLPDLLTSSPRLSRQSTPGSTSDTNQSFETVCTTLSDDDLKSESSEKDISLNESDNAHSLVVFENANSDTQSKSSLSNENSASLKIQVNLKNLCPPIVTVTAPTPTFERSNDHLFCESAKLNIPKDDDLRSSEQTTFTSFDHLKEELKQRKAKNKVNVKELRPLSKENACEQMNKYFEISKSENKNSRKSSLVIEPDNSEVEVVELQIKSTISDKVEQKDLWKYFHRTDSIKKRDVDSKTESEKTEGKVEEWKIGLDIESSIQDFRFTDEIDSDALNEQFNKIEKENEITNETDNSEFYDILLSTLASKPTVEDLLESNLEGLSEFERVSELDTDLVQNISNGEFNSDSKVEINKSNDSIRANKLVEALNKKEEIKLVVVNKKHLNVEKVNLPNIQNAEVQKVKVIEKEIPSAPITNGLAKAEDHSSKIPITVPKRPERKTHVQDTKPLTSEIPSRKNPEKKLFNLLNSLDFEQPNEKLKVTNIARNINEIVDVKTKAKNNLHGSSGSIASSKVEKKNDKCTIS